MCALGSAFTLPLHQLKVSIQPSSADQDTVATLSEVWVRLIGIPLEARRQEVVALVAQTVGKVTEVDLGSLAGHGPVRLRLLCPDTSVFPVSLPRFFFDRVGRDLLVELDEEVAAAEAGLSHPPSHPPADDDAGAGGGGSREEHSDSDLGSDPESPLATDASPPPPCPPQGSSGGTTAPPPAARLSSGGPFFPERRPLSLSAPAKLAPVDLPRCFLPDPSFSIGLDIKQYGSYLDRGPSPLPGPPPILSSPDLETSGSVGLEVCAHQSPRSPGVVCYALAPDTPDPPVLSVSAGVPTTPVDVVKLRRSRAPRPPPPPPSRHSARIADSRTGLAGPEPTVAERASRRVAARDEFSGTASSHVPPDPGPSGLSGSPFCVLSEVSLAHLGEVADDCGIVFRGEKGWKLEQIAAIKAREGYAGAIAAARAHDARERERSQILAGAGPDGPGSSRETQPASDARETTHKTTPPGRPRGRPPKSAAIRSSSPRPRSVPAQGTPPA
uniref:Uncharacterized protein n=1 Tax=Avena sativa TaxID=4498 RepID=A0ACD5YFY4_AVESA